MEKNQYTPDPGETIYPSLKEPLTVKGLGQYESPQIDVARGLVNFSCWDEDVNERVSFVISEWDLGQFVEVWLTARMSEKFRAKKEEHGNDK